MQLAKLRRSVRGVLFGALVAVCSSAFAADVVYLKPLASGETREVIDGTSWATAYTSPADALAAANGEKPVYAAAGVYRVANGAPLTPADGTVFYGGFPGVSESETPADRDIEAYQTILTGENAGAADFYRCRWTHVEPVVDGIAVPVATGLDLKVARLLTAEGRVSVPSFTDVFDSYQPRHGNGTASKCFVISDGCAVTLDGLWFAGFSGSRCCVSVNACKESFIRNCRFVGNTGSAALIGEEEAVSRSAKLHVVNCQFVCNALTGTGGVLFLNGDTEVADCTFVGASGSGVARGFLTHLNKGVTEFRRCVFTRISGYSGTAWHVGNNGGVGLLVAANNGTGGFYDCVASNNFTSSSISSDSGNCGGLQIVNPRAFTFEGSTFVHNRENVTGKAGFSYVMFANGCVNVAETFANCTFASNRIHVVADTTSAKGECAAGIVGTRWNQPTATFTLSNVTFDGNEVTCADESTVTVAKSRGVVSIAPIGLANCTFAGPASPDTVDFLQFGAAAKAVALVNTIFESEGDLENRLRFDNAAVVTMAGVSVKNVAAPAGVAANDLYATDEIPLGGLAKPEGGVVPVRQPLAKTPGIRETADVAINDAATGSLRYKLPDGVWKALVPAISTTVATDDARYIGDANGAERPAGAFTRGAVQVMSAAAENGHTLTIRRDPITAGTLEGPAVQSVEEGAIQSVTALPGEGRSFAGWYLEGATEPFSTEATLALDSLPADAVVIAKYSAGAIDITFDLGSYGTFDGTDESTAVVKAVPDAPFPSVPAYTLDEAWYQTGWSPALPAVTPSKAATYALTAVSSGVRVIRVVPESEACENPDGLTWATAYGDIADAYADAGQYRGEVWIKEGTYVLKGAIAWKPNVTVRGGFVGTETSADEADPAAHPTVISGDVNGDDYWKPDNTNPAVADRVMVWENGVLNYPAPTEDQNAWYPGFGNGENTASAFVAESDTAMSDCGFSGLTFTGFSGGAIVAKAPVDVCLTVRDCRFVNCSGANGQLYLDGNRLDVADSSFVGCTRGVGIFWDGRTVTGESVVSNCTFYSMSAPNYGACIYLYGGVRFQIVDSRFERSLGTDQSWMCSPTLTVNKNGTGRVRGCTFVDNRATGTSQGIVALSSDTTIEKCSFVGNRMISSGNQACASAALSLTGGSNLIRDCWFASNIVETATTTANSIWATAIAVGGSGVTALNCSFWRNRAKSDSDASCHLAGTALSNSGPLALVNCIFAESELTGDQVAELGCAAAKTSTFTVFNSVALNAADDYVPVKANATLHFGMSNSYLTNFDESQVPRDPAANCFLYSLIEKAPALKRGFAHGAKGTVPQLAIAGNSPAAFAGTNIWQGVEGRIYFYDPRYNVNAPWRCVSDTGWARSDKNAGLTLDSPTLPDAFDEPNRKLRKYRLGPVNPDPLGLILMVR